MVKKEDIEMLTVEEFMDGLDYAVKKKKRKLITDLKKEADKQYPNVPKEDILPQMDIQKNTRQNVVLHEDIQEITKQDDINKKDENIQDNIEDTQRTQAIRDLSNQSENIVSSKDLKKKKKYNPFLLIAFILGMLYSVYLFYYCLSTAGSGNDVAENLGIGIGITLIMPHLVCAVLATIFNGLGVFLNKRAFALTGAILYTIACVLMPIYFMFTIIQAILSYIGFATLKNKTYIPLNER